MPGQSIGCILATLHCVQGWCHDMPHGGLGSSTRGLYNRIESFFPCIRTHFPLKIPDRHKIFRRRGSFHSSVPPLSSANPPPPPHRRKYIPQIRCGACLFIFIHLKREAPQQILVYKGLVIYFTI